MEVLKIGDRIKDNDPRMGKRILEITEVNGSYVFATTPIGRTVRISINHIYVDARKRRTGFSKCPAT